jgi:CRISPR-associated protein Csx17
MTLPPAPRPVQRIPLTACRTRPLASYLKALAILRIVSEQADPDARGCWEHDHFVLFSRLGRDGLVEFLLDSWRPMPFMSPWNKGSGLLSNDTKGVQPLVRSRAERFEDVRDGIRQSAALTEMNARAVREEKDVKDEKTRLKGEAKTALAADPEYKRRLAEAARKCKRLKDELQPNCQRRWRGAPARWLRTAIVLSADGTAKFPALLGTGGNDGKLDFTNNAMQRLGSLFDLDSEDGTARPIARPSLLAALFDEPAPALVTGGIGQYAPAASGGANATSGPLGDTQLNPWDLPLLLEGTLCFTAGTARRLGAGSTETTVAPFSARPVAAGYGSASAADEGARGEQWMPLWSRPWTLSEVKALLHEGRCQLGRSGARSSMDVARAVARLGVARGVDAFERYAFMERNGKSYYAVSLGQVPVRCESSARLFDDLDAFEWWSRIRRAARADKAPASIAVLEKQLAEAAFAVVQHGGEPARWQQVLVALARLEAQCVVSGAFTVSQRLRPIPALSRGWLEAANDGSPEFRLACVLAAASPGLRRHWLPLSKKGDFAVASKTLARDPSVVCHGLNAESDLIALVQRRLIESRRASLTTLDINPGQGLGAGIDDVEALLSGNVDLDHTLWLARALSAVRWRDLESRSHIRRRSVGFVDPLWSVVRLCHLPKPWRGGPLLPADPAVARLLSTGDFGRAFGVCAQRLRSAGIVPGMRVAAVSPERARRIVASLAFPIAPETAVMLAQDLSPASMATSIEQGASR